MIRSNWFRRLLITSPKTGDHSTGRRRRLAIESLEDRTTPTAAPHLVADINLHQSPFDQQSSYPSNFAEVNGTLFFTASDSAHGRELWKSDGTAEGTVLVKNISPDQYYSFGPSNLTNVDGTLYFAADDGVHGQELWKSDGTEAGTVLVKDISAGPYGYAYSSYPGQFRNVNGTLFFTADDGVNGRELWKSDGTDAGTMMVKDINTDSYSSSYPEQLTNVDGTLFFTANDGINGGQLWKSDGTEAGTVIVKTTPGFGQYVYDLTAVGGTLFFNGYDDANPGRELWKSDGTDAGTVMVKDISPGAYYDSNPMNLTDVNGTLYFMANDNVNGRELWKSDGTESGTVLVKDIVPGAYYTYFRDFTNVNGTLFFSANDGSSGYELWKSDGTDAGTMMVSDIGPGSYSSYPSDLTNVNGTLYFVTWDPLTGTDLWTSDGSESGTVFVKNVGYLPYSYQYQSVAYAAVNGNLFFAADAGDGRGMELWKSDGTDAGTVMVKDIEAITYSSYPQELRDVNGTLYFQADDGDHGTELWKTDGTAAGTSMVKDIDPGSDTSFPIYLTNVDGTLYFAASDGTSGVELWKSDGTQAGTVRVKDIAPGSSSSYPSNLVNVDGTLFFNVNGSDLWKSDGTAAGTVLVKSNLFIGDHAVIDGIMYFATDDGINGTELWKSDGTDTGTVMVNDIQPVGSSYPRGLVAVGETLYFSADDGVNGRELWTSDGTDAGTVMVKDINPGPYSSAIYPYRLTNVNGTLYFAANDGVNGAELWMSDGTEAGTVMVKDINTDPYSSSYPEQLTNVNGTLFFTANDGANGYELWKSDGTDAGTVLVKDIGAGPYSSYSSALTSVGGTLYFLTNPNFNGTDLWMSDGTETGTVQIQSNSNYIDSYSLTASHGALFYVFNDNEHGAELWTFGTNTAPTSTGIGDQTIDEDGAPIVINLGDAFSDAEQADADLVYTIESNSNPGLSASVDITGTTLTVTPVADGFGGSDFVVRATDPDGLFADASFHMTVNPVNDAPILDSINNLGINEDDAEQSIGLTGIGVGPANEAASGQTIASVVADSDNPGLIANPTVDFTGGVYSLKFTPVANASGSATISVTVTDDGGTAFGGVNSVTKTFTVNVAAENDAPILDTDPITILPAIPPKAQPTNSLISKLDGGVTDVDAGALKGIAVTGMDSTKGTWKYSTDGTSFNPIPSDVSTVKALLLADDGNTQIRFEPNKGFNGFASISYKAWDRSGVNSEGVQVDTTLPGSTAYSSATEHAWVAVGKTKFKISDDGSTLLTAVKEDAKSSKTNLAKNVFGIAGLEQDVDKTIGIAITHVSTGNGTWQYKPAKTKTWLDVPIVNEANPLDLGPTDQLRFIPNPNANGTASFQFNTWDPALHSLGAFGSTELATIAVNDAPTLDLSKAAVLNPVDAGGTTSDGVTFASLMSANDVEGANVGVAIVASKGGSWEYRSVGDTGWTPVGKVSTGKALFLDATDEIRIENATAGTPRLSFKAWDKTNGKSDGDIGPAKGTAVSKQTEILTVAVGNSVPELADGNPPLGNVGSKKGVSIKSLLNSAVTDSDGPKLGIAITGLTGANGTWEYSLGGNKWAPIGNVSAAAALLLSDASKIRFNGTGIVTIQYKAWDQSAGQVGDRIDTTGLLNSFSTFTEDASITIA